MLIQRQTFLVAGDKTPTRCDSPESGWRMHRGHGNTRFNGKQEERERRKNPT